MHRVRLSLNPIVITLLLLLIILELQLLTLYYFYVSLLKACILYCIVYIEF